MASVIRLLMLRIIFSTNSWCVMHIVGSTNFLAKPPYPSHSRSHTLLLLQWCNYLKSSRKNIPRFSASSSEQKWIAGTMHFRIWPKKERKLKLGTRSLCKSLQNWKENRASLAECIRRGKKQYWISTVESSCILFFLASLSSWFLNRSGIFFLRKAYVSLYCCA